MLFDARAALARIRADAPAIPAAKTQSEPVTGATRATCATPQAPLSVHVAQVAQVARLRPSEPENAPLPGGAAVLPLHGPASRPKPAPSAPAVPLHGGKVRLDWSGESVSRDRWEAVTDLERHSPQGRLFCGKCWRWRDRDTALRCLDGEACP